MLWLNNHLYKLDYYFTDKLTRSHQNFSTSSNSADTQMPYTVIKYIQRDQMQKPIKAISKIVRVRPPSYNTFQIIPQTENMTVYL